MLSAGMLIERALSIARRSREFASGSPPPARAATAISRATLVNMALRLESLTPFWRLIVDHLECPDIGREYTHYDRRISPGDRPTGSHRRPSGPASPRTRQRTCAPSRRGRH